ncbi:hydroxyisourate hydrolase [Terrabacter terrigena]|uniref:5-hydroxyisourate hydrolase n=1 Tax=Terrabacter terrigena TaxID=574718 RepID=A0ABW3N183_9MICO
MGTLSTHVLDTSAGRPAEGIAVALRDHRGRVLDQGETDTDGRIGAIGPERLAPGDYSLRFDTAAYFTGSGTTGFYPEVTIAFTIADAGQHYHVPLLLNPFGYSTYRGS